MTDGQSTESTSKMSDARAVADRLEAAFRVLLKDNFEVEFRSMLEARGTIGPAVPGAELFRLWILGNLYGGSDPTWIFGPLRPSERRLLADQLAIPRQTLVGRSPRDIGKLTLAAAGLPCCELGAGRDAMKSGWGQILQLAKSGDDERAAVQARGRAERFLRQQLIFFASTGFGPSAHATLREPGNLRLPNRLAKLVEAGGAIGKAFAELLREDGWADLGFLCLFLRKFGAQLEREGAQTLSGDPIVLCNQREFDAFTGLSSALQPYAHDRPSATLTRTTDLVVALKSVDESLEAMIARGVVPDEMLVLEACSTCMGASFSGVRCDGQKVAWRSDSPPALGRRVLFIASAEEPLAECVWLESPWHE